MSETSVYIGIICGGALLGLLFRVLTACLSATGRAGLERLAENHTNGHHLVRKWSRNWRVVESAQHLAAAFFYAACLYALYHILHGREPLAWYIGGTVALLFFLADGWLPQLLAESYADRMTHLFFPASAALAVLLYPLAWPLSQIEQWLARLLDLRSSEEDKPSTGDEIRSLVEQAEEEDLDEEEREFIKSVFEFGDTVTHEIMTPRVDIQCVEDTETVTDCLDQILKTGFSRFPVYHENVDDIRGILLIKDVLKSLHEGHPDQPVIKLAHRTPFVPEFMPISDLMKLMQGRRSHLAVVVDEYGGTAGLVTLEDIVEELLGEIQDEHDEEEASEFQRISEYSAIFPARMNVNEINELMQSDIPEADEYDSVGGYIFSTLGHIPNLGEEITGPAYTLTVQAADARSIHSVRIDCTPKD